LPTPAKTNKFASLIKKLSTRIFLHYRRKDPRQGPALAFGVIYKAGRPHKHSTRKPDSRHDSLPVSPSQFSVLPSLLRVLLKILRALTAKVGAAGAWQDLPSSFCIFWSLSQSGTTTSASFACGGLETPAPLEIKTVRGWHC